MKFVSILLILLAVCITTNEATAQEINCTVKVVSDKIQNSNKQIFEGLQYSLENFLNGYKWTSDKFTQDEKINITFVFNLSKLENNTDFETDLMVLYSRPVYGSSYNSPIIKVNDREVAFSYKQSDQMVYTEGTFVNNLTSVLAFYVYWAIGIDYDTFSEFGGTTYLNKALDIANSAQTSGYGGWAAYTKGRDNRYWLIFHYLDERFKPIRQAMYTYHRQGMDKFTQDMTTGRATIMTSLKAFQQANQNQPGSFLLQNLMEAKRQEIIDIFSKATLTEKNELMKIVESIDVAFSSKYRTALLN